MNKKLDKYSLAQEIKGLLDGMLELDFMAIDSIETKYDECDGEVSVKVKMAFDPKVKNFSISITEF